MRGTRPSVRTYLRTAGIASLLMVALASGCSSVRMPPEKVDTPVHKSITPQEAQDTLGSVRLHEEAGYDNQLRLLMPWSVTADARYRYVVRDVSGKTTVTTGDLKTTPPGADALRDKAVMQMFDALSTLGLGYPPTRYMRGNTLILPETVIHAAVNEPAVLMEARVVFVPGQKAGASWCIRSADVTVSSEVPPKGAAGRIWAPAAKP
jgi:hypothetical protein